MITNSDSIKISKRVNFVITCVYKCFKNICATCVICLIYLTKTNMSVLTMFACLNVWREIITLI